MGVRGLSSFFNQNPDFFKPYKLHDSLVIFDGDNLLHRLYFDYRVNFMYGGDYKKYADSIRRYLLAFLECQINPIIIFDGGYDKSGRKMKTILERAVQRLTQVKHITKSGDCCGRLLPMLAREVFLSVLVELDIVFAVCDYEADDQITALANYYKCPVISADSDFYIYNVHKGFIHLDSINTTVIVDTDDRKEFSYLSCKMYDINDFVSCFPGIDVNVLPLFGTLIGNDYVEAKEFDNFFSNIQLPKYKGRKLILNTKQKKMIGLLCWLKNNTLNEAVDQVMQYLKKNKREYVKSVIQSAISGYEIKNCNLTHIIDKKLYNLKNELCFTSRLVTPCGSSLPFDFVIQFHIGQYSAFCINVIVLHKVFLVPQIEDISFASSSYACSRHIRKIIYGILVRHDIGNNVCQDEKCLVPIEENDRHGNKFQKELVEPIFSIEDIGNLPKVNELNNLQKEESVLILTKVLGFNSEFFLNLPEDWQLFIGCVNYWLCNCEPYCTESFLYALVINLIYFGTIHPSSSAKYQFECSNKKSTYDQCTCSAVKCILTKINKSEVQNAEMRLKKYGVQPSINRGNPLLMHIIHSYSQVQSCVKSVILLNKLLGEYLISPTPQTFFSGTMLYNLTKDISTRSNPELFVAEILGRGTNLYALFAELNSKICQHVPHNRILKNQLSFQKHKKKSSKRFDPVKNSSCTVKNFDVLNRVEVL